MQTIVIRLVPAKLKNYDIDLIFDVTDEIERVTKWSIISNEFDDNLMAMWFETENARESYPLIVKLFSKKKFLKNDLSKSAEIYISENEHESIENCTRVYPE